jgi:8-oxo-dGTP pyrophosphatase MutT (NUDIX family)
MPEILKTHINAGVAIYADAKFLLVQEKNPKCYGQWNWPAGRVDVGSTIEQSAVREVAEETGFLVRLIAKVDIFEQALNPYVPMHLFLGEIVGGELKVSEDEILDARWFSLEELEALPVRDPWVVNGARMIAAGNV